MLDELAQDLWNLQKCLSEHAEADPVQPKQDIHV